MSDTAFSVLSLDTAARIAADGGFGLETSPNADTGLRGRVYVRREFDIGSFGVNAFYQANDGAIVVAEHDELGPASSRHEELYVVLEGGCRFTVDGEDVDAPRGTAIFVRDPASKRAARATADGTIVLVVGGRRGEAFEVGPSESLGAFYRRYRSGDYEGALAACREALESHPGNPLILYNIACLESRLGRPEPAVTALAESIAAWPKFRELAADDDDLASLREDPRLQELWS